MGRGVRKVKPVARRSNSRGSNRSSIKTQRESARKGERLKESKAAVDVLFALSLSRAVLVFAGGAAVRCFGETQKNAKA